SPTMRFRQRLAGWVSVFLRAMVGSSPWVVAGSVRRGLASIRGGKQEPRAPGGPMRGVQGGGEGGLHRWGRRGRMVAPIARKDNGPPKWAVAVSRFPCPAGAPAVGRVDRPAMLRTGRRGVQLALQRAQLEPALHLPPP